MINILIADDEPGFREMLIYILQPMAFEIEEVENGLQAFQKIQEKAYSLLLMDVHMPVLTGPEALEKIRAVRPEQKVIIFSSNSDSSLSEAAIKKHDVIALLHKPVELAEIEKALEKALGKLPGRFAA